MEISCYPQYLIAEFVAKKIDATFNSDYSMP